MLEMSLEPEMALGGTVKRVKEVAELPVAVRDYL